MRGENDREVEARGHRQGDFSFTQEKAFKLSGDETNFICARFVRLFNGYVEDDLEHNKNRGKEIGVYFTSQGKT